MIYLMDRLDFEILDFNKECYFSIDMFETVEQRVIRWLENERSRSIFSKSEIVNLFRTKHKIQMVKIDKIRLKKFDKIIIWTKSGRYFVLKVLNVFR